MDADKIVTAIKSAAKGIRDYSGKTALDVAAEEINSGNRSLRNAAAVKLATWLNVIPEADELKWFRHLVRRTFLNDRMLAEALERVLNTQSVINDVERRRWISLTLADIEFPRTIASLDQDFLLRAKYPGEWLSLVIANKSYPDALRAFIKAIKEDLVPPKQLCLKAELIRQNFGAVLPQFLKMSIAAYANKDERREVTEVVRRLYGFDLSAAVEKPGLVDSPGLASNDIDGADASEELAVESWCKPETLKVVESAFADAA
jgi:hypothetical protein